MNLRGEFNVPRGTKNTVIFPKENFADVARTLRRVMIKCCDFEEAIAGTVEGDFLFVDPPYTVKHNNNGFLKYNESIFTWADQLRLCRAVTDASKRGVRVLVTNANHRPIRDLYRQVGDLRTLPRSSVLSGAAHGRGLTSELAVLVNFKT